MDKPEGAVHSEREAHFLAFFVGNDEVCIKAKKKPVNTPGSKRGAQDEDDEVDDEEGQGPTYKWSHGEHMKVNIYEIFYLLNHSHNGKYKLFTVHRYLV